MGKSLKNVFDFRSPEILPQVKKEYHGLFKKSERIIIHDNDFGYTIGYLYAYPDRNVFATETDINLDQVTAWAPIPKGKPDIETAE